MFAEALEDRTRSIERGLQLPPSFEKNVYAKHQFATLLAFGVQESTASRNVAASLPAHPMLRKQPAK